jgi:Tol biopolymer transport system component
MVVAIVALAGLVASVASAGGGGPKTKRVSVKANGSEVPGANSEYASMSASGRLIVFETDAKFVGKDDANDFDIYLYNRRTKRQKLISVKSNGSDGTNVGAAAADISPNGRYVCFGVDGALVDRDDNGLHDVYRHDRKTGKTILISQTNDEQLLDGLDDDSELCGVANNGIVAWESMGAFVDDDTNGDLDVFVRNPGNGTTKRATLDYQDNQLDGGGDIGKDSLVAISADGKRVAFETFAVATAEPDTAFNINGFDSDVFVRNLGNGTTSRVSLRSNGQEALSFDNANSRRASMSADGRYVAFWSDAPFTGTDNNSGQDIYVRDRKRGKTFRATVKSNGDEVPNADIQWFEIAASGRYLAFDTFSNFGGGPDPTNLRDVYRRDFENKKTTLVSLKANGGRGDGNQLPFVSDNGKWVVWQTMDPMTGQPDDGMDWDVFLRGPLR